MADLHHRATAPIIKRLKQGWQQPKEDELRRLFGKLPDLDDRSREAISESFELLINKLLHPPL
jgi:glutamyl-tRNA reductase